MGRLGRGIYVARGGQSNEPEGAPGVLSTGQQGGVDDDEDVGEAVFIGRGRETAFRAPWEASRTRIEGGSVSENDALAALYGAEAEEEAELQRALELSLAEAQQAQQRTHSSSRKGEEGGGIAVSQAREAAGEEGSTIEDDAEEAALAQAIAESLKIAEQHMPPPIAGPAAAGAAAAGPVHSTAADIPRKAPWDAAVCGVPTQTHPVAQQHAAQEASAVRTAAAGVQHALAGAALAMQRGESAEEALGSEAGECVERRCDAAQEPDVSGAGEEESLEALRAQVAKLSGYRERP